MPQTQQLSAEEIVELKGELEGSQATQARMSAYKQVNDYLKREYIESERYGTYASKEDRDRFSWETGDDDTDYVVSISKIHLILQDQIAFLGAPHSVRVPSIGTNQAYCDKLERGIAHLNRQWNMDRRKQEIAHYSTTYGTGVGMLQWDTQNKIPTFRARSPENCFVQPSVDDETQAQVVFFVTETLGRSIIADYPKVKGVDSLDPAETYDLIDYYSKTERVRLINEPTLELLRARHSLERVPVYFFPGMLLPNSIWGGSMVLRAIPIEKETNRLYSVQALYLRDAVEAPMMIKDPVNVPENARWNRDCTIEVGPQGGVGRAPIASIDGQMIQARIMDMDSHMNQIMDFSPIMQGQAVGSYLTGKGVTSLQQPIIQRLSSKLQPQHPVYAQMYKDALRLWHKAGKGSYSIYGTKEKSSFAEVFDPKADIDPGYVENIVYLDTAAFVDRTSAKIAAVQEVGAGLRSKRRFLELDPDCDDVEKELAQIAQEQTEEATRQMQIQMQAQAAMQPPMMPGGSPPTPPVGGAMPGSAAPSSPPLGTEGAAPGPGGEDILASVADVFRSVKKVRGQVFLVGEILRDGLTVEEITAGFLEVVISDPLDKQTILNGIRQTEIGGFADQGKIVFHENMDMLASQVNLEVTPGTSGTTLNEGAPEEPAEPGMEDVGPGIPGEEEAMMAAMMGAGGAPPGGAGEMPPEMMGV